MMPVCRSCGLIQHYGACVKTRRVQPGDRHSRGYMRLYMATRRAIERGLACQIPRSA